jgi:hypothetical protein
MPLSRGEETTGRAHSQISGSDEDRYATREDFLKIFDEDLKGLYQLSFLLTGEHQKGERCFVSGIEDCAKEDRVFRSASKASTSARPTSSATFRCTQSYTCKAECT